MTKPFKIVYAGTPEFAVPALSELVAVGYDVVAVYTQPDRPAGRGRELKASPVKAFAQEHDIPVYQPESLKTIVEQETLVSLKPNLMVVAAYGLILPKAVLEIPELGCINIHASLLPRWRGAAPIQRAIQTGDDKTGITIMQMNEGLDTGGMLTRTECSINHDDTSSSLHDRLMVLGAETLIEMLPRFISGECEVEKQDEPLATYASKLNKQEAELDWKQPATDLELNIRAYNAWPVAHTYWRKRIKGENKEQILRIWKALAVDEKHDVKPGTVIGVSKQGIKVATGDGILEMLQVQPEGKKAMSSANFSNANNIENQVLGRA